MMEWQMDKPFTKRADEKNYTSKPENKHFGIIQSPCMLQTEGWCLQLAWQHSKDDDQIQIAWHKKTCNPILHFSFVHQPQAGFFPLLCHFPEKKKKSDSEKSHLKPHFSLSFFNLSQRSTNYFLLINLIGPLKRCCTIVASWKRTERALCKGTLNQPDCNESERAAFMIMQCLEMDDSWHPFDPNRGT